MAHEVDRDALVKILTEPRNALVKQYQRLFELDNVVLEFDAGALEAEGGPVEVEVEAAAPSGLQDLLGADRSVWLGRVALTAAGEPSRRSLADSCAEYVDHYE